MPKATGYLVNLICKITGYRQNRNTDFMYYGHYVSLSTVEKITSVSIDMGRIFFTFCMSTQTVEVYAADNIELLSIKTTFSVIYPSLKLENKIC